MSERLVFESQKLERRYGKEPMELGHRLEQSELFSLDRLGELAGSLPDELVEHNVGDLPQVVADGQVERSTMSPAEIARTIDTNGLWMVLKNVETDPAYAAVLNELLDEVEEKIGSLEGGMRDREGFIFMSAPDSVTPSHTDPEHNFLLQLRGTKEISVGRFPDERTRQLELEQHAGGGHRNVDWKPVDPLVATLDPGSAIYVPPHAPHWVKNGPAGSVSFSITWPTAATDRTFRVSAMNARLRRLGLSPTPPGRRPAADSLKVGASRAFGRLRR